MKYHPIMNRNLDEETTQLLVILLGMQVLSAINEAVQPTIDGLKELTLAAVEHLDTATATIDIKGLQYKIGLLKSALKANRARSCWLSLHLPRKWTKMGRERLSLSESMDEVQLLIWWLESRPKAEELLQELGIQI